MKGFEYTVGFLKEKNVKTVFSYPGSAITELFEALCNSDIENIVASHEQGAVHSADGYARASGGVGVVVATSGPGAVNLVTGLCNAYLDSIPIIAITGQVKRELIGHDAFQEADIMGITIPVTKHNFLVKDIENLPTVLEEAWRIATHGRPGPVLIDIPRDVLNKRVTAPASPKLPHIKKQDYPLCEMSQKIYSLISKAYRPIFLLGGGVIADTKAPPLFAELINKLKIPAVYTLMGKSAIDNHSPFCLGMAGVHGHHRANDALYKSDLVIAVGCRFSDRTIPCPEELSQSRVVIHADIDQAELNKNVATHCVVTCSASDFADELLSFDFDLDRLSHFEHWSDKCTQRENISPLSPLERAIEIIDRVGGRRVVCDVGAHQMSAARICKAAAPRRFIASGGLGTMGFGLPAAIGAALATGEDITLFCGDAGFQMTLNELSLLGGLCKNIKIFLIDNGSFGMVKELSLEEKKETIYKIKGSPDFALLAKAYGISCLTVGAEDITPRLVEEIFARVECELVVIKI